MKNNKGITLVTLVIYIVVMLISISLMGIINNNFYANNKGIYENVQDVLEFNKFNTYFLKEIKKKNNSVEKIQKNENENYILFSNGNSFKKNADIIYYNNIKICENVEDITFEEKDENIIKVTLDFINFGKTIEYKIESIY